MYINDSIQKYLTDLAAKKAAPGGGSAAALSAAIGVSLMSMVANFTVGNPKYKANEAQATVILTRSEKYRRELQALVDKDVEAYEKLSVEIKKSDKGSPELDKLYKGALTPPFEVCKITSEALKVCKDLAACGNENLITDTATAAILLEGAFFSAKFDVYANLKYIKDIDFVGEIHKVLAPLEESMPGLKEEILEICEDAIAK